MLVAGTCSGAGKSTVVAGLCRYLHRRGVSVAPFKAQNMSLNSFVTARGDEIARAQALQAQAAGVDPEAAMNPVLLKPGDEGHSHVIVMGRAIGETDARAYWSSKRDLLDVVVAAHEDLRTRFDVVVCEGAGSPAEINLRASDIVNLGFARAVDAPTVVVGDIDRGGVFASFVGTLALLSPEDQALVRGFVVNRFRGDRGVLEPGLVDLFELTGRPTYGVIPYVRGLWLDAEDAPDPWAYLHPSPPVGPEVLRVAVARLPRASNLTDLDPLVAEAGVVVRLVQSPEELADADLVVIPGTRATVSDLAWLRERGFDGALRRRAAAGLPVLGLCGGYQMLGTEILDDVESRAGRVEGLGLLPVRTTFSPTKILRRPRRTLSDGSVIEGYEIHHGEVERLDGGGPGAEPLFADEGCRRGAVTGTVWHGLFENDVWRRAYLEEVAGTAGRRWVPSEETSFADLREKTLDGLADLVEEHLDTEALLGMLDSPLPGSCVPPVLTLSRTP
ncbi:MAG TPA: cobyric acid synthase [Acidimicrobiales bacterium]|nr:cobyric acid synthase [Acidimicrobiales bacterium]